MVKHISLFNQNGPFPEGYSCHIYDFCSGGGGGGGEYSHVTAYGDVLPKWVTFSPKLLGHGSHYGQKILGRRVLFHKICEKIVKSAIFEAEKPLEMGLDLRKF